MNSHCVPHCLIEGWVELLARLLSPYDRGQVVSFYYVVINYRGPSEITGWDEQIEESCGFCPNLFGFEGGPQAWEP